jgi:hypothetical protein
MPLNFDSTMPSYGNSCYYIGCANYIWMIFKPPRERSIIVFEFFTFQTKYSLASADANQTGEEQNGGYMDVLVDPCGRKPVAEEEPPGGVREEDLAATLTQLQSVGLLGPG